MQGTRANDPIPTHTFASGSPADTHADETVETSFVLSQLSTSHERFVEGA